MWGIKKDSMMNQWGTVCYNIVGMLKEYYWDSAVVEVHPIKYKLSMGPLLIN